MMLSFNNLPGSSGLPPAQSQDWSNLKNSCLVATDRALCGDRFTVNTKDTLKFLKLSKHGDYCRRVNILCITSLAFVVRPELEFDLLHELLVGSVDAVLAPAGGEAGFFLITGVDRGY